MSLLVIKSVMVSDQTNQMIFDDINTKVCMHVSGIRPVNGIVIPGGGEYPIIVAVEIIITTQIHLDS